MTEFFTAGGYGPYLWSAYGITAFFMLFEVFMVKQQYRAASNRIKRILRSGL